MPFSTASPIEPRFDRAICFGTSTTERKRSEAKLASAYAHLETRVQERTSELGDANRNLEDSLRIVERSRRDFSLVGDLVEFLQTCQNTRSSRNDGKFRTKGVPSTDEMLSSGDGTTFLPQ